MAGSLLCALGTLKPRMTVAVFVVSVRHNHYRRLPHAATIARAKAPHVHFLKSWTFDLLKLDWEIFQATIRAYNGCDERLRYFSTVIAEYTS